MDVDLKPCPFCGGGAEIGADMNTFPDVACDACGASVSGRGVDGAIEAWNTRADTSEVEALREEVAKLHEIIDGVGANFWDRAELSERDEAGHQTILLWHPSGMPLLRLSVHSHNPNMEPCHRDLVMSDLLDVFDARAALAKHRGGA